MTNPDWAPTVAQVGAVLRSRTTDANGVEQGTFTATTRPTEDQAELIIADVVQDVVAVLGFTLPDRIAPLGTAVAALGAAALIELTYWPEQVASGKSPYEQLNERYEKQLQRARVALTQIDASGEIDAEVGDVLLPVGNFPVDIGGLVDWETEF